MTTLQMMLLGEGIAAPPVVTNIAATTGGPAATVSITVPAGGVPAGCAIYVLVYELGLNGVLGQVGSVADNASTPNTYAALINQSDTAGSSLQIFQAFNVNALTSGKIITYTMIDSGNPAAISAFYVTGLTTTNPKDTVTYAQVSFNSGNPSLVSGTPSQAGELFIAVAGWDNSTDITAGYTLDTGNGWSGSPPTKVEGDFSGDFYGVGGGVLIDVGSGTKTTAPTFANISTTVGAVLVLGLKTH